MHVEKASWGGLSCVVVDDLPEGISPSLAVIFCHGYGAPATDLVGLAAEFFEDRQIADQTVMIFPAAPLDLSARGLPGGRAWWNIDLDRLLNRPSPELLASFRRDCPPGLPESRALLLALLAGIEEKYSLSPSRLILGGFSQGAMLATDVALRMDVAPAALCLFSGALVNENEWSSLAASRQGLKVLQTHGRFDSILPLPMATALRDLLQGAGCAVEFVTFPGDHGIPAEALERAQNLIAKVLRSTAGSRRPA